MLALCEKEFILAEKQKEAIELIRGPATHVLFYGGARSMKTFTCVRTFIYRSLMVPDCRHLIGKFRFNSVKQAIFLDTFPKVMKLCFPEVPFEKDRVDFYVKFENGSEIWFGGFDDKERAEKILGKEFAGILLDECSQISYETRLLLLTRLAQKCPYELDGEIRFLRNKMLYAENPPSRGHWTHKLFLEHRDPVTKLALPNPENYASMRLNPEDNRENLSEEYLEELQNLPKKQKDRFWFGLFSDETENALWTEAILNENRVDGVPDNVKMVRIVVPIDPSGASDDPEESNDDIGIGVMGLGTDGNAYVFEDLTVHAGPAKWGSTAVSAYQRHEADCIVGEDNFGGEMVKFVVMTAAKENNTIVSYKKVKASRGKVVRAEPASALHEQGKIKFIGRFDALEDELLAFTNTGYTGMKSPNRADWFIWGVYELFPRLTSPVPEFKSKKALPPTRTRAGWRPR